MKELETAPHDLDALYSILVSEYEESHSDEQLAI